MASPIAHSFAGFWIFLALAEELKGRLLARWRQWLLQLAVLVLLANLPDVDFLLGFFQGNPNNAHRDFTHSLAAAVLISLALSCVWRITVSFWRSAILYFAAYSSHLLIDFFTGTKIGWTNTGFGMPLLWPWGKTFSSPLTLFLGIHHKDFAALFSLDNVWACTYELLTCTIVTLVVGLLWKRRLKSRTNRPKSEAPAHLLSNLQ